MGADITLTKPTILFDGVCNLCNSSVDFVIRRDQNDTFQFASLQSSYARNHPLIPNDPTKNLDTVILLKDQKVYTKSSAALRIAKELNGFWPLLYLFVLIPKAFRDLVYDWVASNRYRWFGKSETCRIPTEKECSKFIDDLQVV